MGRGVGGAASRTFALLDFRHGSDVVLGVLDS